MERSRHGGELWLATLLQVARKKNLLSLHLETGNEPVKISVAADACEFAFEGETVEGIERQGEEEADSAVEMDERIAERLVDLFRSAFDCCWIGNTPVSRHGLTGPDGTDFAGGVVTDGEDEIEWGSAGLGEFVPGLAAEAGGWKVRRVEKLECDGMNGAFGVAAGTVGGEIRGAFLIEDGFGEDGAGGIAGAEE